MAMAERRSQWRLQTREYFGEISALCFLHLPPDVSSFPYLLAGTGSQMLIYDLEVGNIIKSFYVFEGIRIHGIATTRTNHVKGSLSSMVAFKIAVYGERRVKLFNLNIEKPFFNQNLPKLRVDLVLLHKLPKFGHWVLDASFLKFSRLNSLHKGSWLLAVGCSDNAVCLWDIQRHYVILEVRCPERCLLYSMCLWGEELEDLRVASGTIYNEILVWKIVLQNCATYLKDEADFPRCFNSHEQLHDRWYAVVHMHRLAGHEGSIFRIAWSSDGSTLVSVSDDRSARVWIICDDKRSSADPVERNNPELIGHVLFGHDARVWDCCISDSLIVTAGEDCTCRVWGLNGEEVKMIKEHVGRGIWRCVYDPISSLLITAGFDSSIKVHQLYPAVGGMGRGEDVTKFIDRTEIITAHIPKLSEFAGIMDSKSEYVRCLRFAYEDAFYVATNHGYIYHAKLCNAGAVKWTELVQVGKDVPIVCMDLLPGNLSQRSSYLDDRIAVGDGRGGVTIITVGSDVSTPTVSLKLNWSAELERQLLGTYWCKSLGHRYIFTADPRGVLKLWKLSDPLASASQNSLENISASLLAEFVSCFGIRIMCLDALFDEELLVCGDLRGNMLLFPLLKSTLLGAPSADVRVRPLKYFKGAHGISTVSSISAVARDGFNEIEICSTGGDGCICYLEYGKDHQNLEFTGMKQVKELSLIEFISTDSYSSNGLATGNYAIGFASADFIIWNLVTEAKVVQVSCGGWRRPHSYYLGDLPDLKSCFAYVKDDTIYIYRLRVADGERKLSPQNLHLQFHGREVHCATFVARGPESCADEFHNSLSSFIATGCEDGTVRLTRYKVGGENWCASKLLGEHVGGSAVRSICCVSKIHNIATNLMNMLIVSDKQVESEDKADPILLISVGAKRVLTSWLLGNISGDKKEEAITQGLKNGTVNGLKPSFGDISLMAFRWLSTDMPTKRSILKSENNKIARCYQDDYNVEANASSLSTNLKNNDVRMNVCHKYENDLRYLAVTAFLVKDDSSRFPVCFVVVACSDATLVLRALILPSRFWFDVALLAPISSPVLALQHVIIPINLPSEDHTQIGWAFILLSGSTDGSIVFWDLSVSIMNFMQWLSTSSIQNSFNSPNRPRTGRGSQGGRLWKSLCNGTPKLKPQACGKTNDRIYNCSVIGVQSEPKESSDTGTASSQSFLTSSLKSEEDKNYLLYKTCEILPLRVCHNVHQSGVNCLHVTEIKNDKEFDFGSQYVVLSGGDDQSLHCVGFDLELLLTSPDHDGKTPSVLDVPKSWGHKYNIRFKYKSSIGSAHSSAVKGIWTDGNWAFTTGLDQRVRCWQLEEHGKLTECDHVVVTVPEPESLDARACGCNHYQIVVVGRGMQMVEFSPLADDGTQ